MLVAGGVLLALGPPIPASAQIAITEVMATASFDSSNIERPDFWELTNFGAEPVNLEGYRWGDDSDIVRFEEAIALPFPPGEGNVAAAESIIFCRKKGSIKDAQAFMDWWGAGLPPGTRIYFWETRPGGINGDGDGAVRIWNTFGSLVDEVSFGTATRGVTFTYDSVTGAFTQNNVEGVDGAFRAARGGDVGSPGVAQKRPVAPVIIGQPQSQQVEAGTETVLSIRATGRPLPTVQWYCNGLPIETVGHSGATAPRLVFLVGCGPRWRLSPDRVDLVLPNVQPDNEGVYYAEVFNGAGEVTSEVAVLTVNNQATPPQLDCATNSLSQVCPCSGSSSTFVVSPGQEAVFSAGTRGYPSPQFQWSYSADGISFVDLPGQTGTDLVLTDVQAAEVGLYRVQLENGQGKTNFTAGLVVRPRASLKITEAMSTACGGLARDWWELTNTGNEEVDLCGYRWDDDTFRIGSGATIASPVILQPGESVILMESQAAKAFTEWWGAAKLPDHLQFIVYSGNGLSSGGDNISVWNATETDRAHAIDQVTFSAGTPGVSFWFDAERCSASGCPECGVRSVEGECGVFRAAEGCDIGSPGWTRWTPPQLTSARREGNDVVLSWKAQPGSVNRLEFAQQLARSPQATGWQELGTYQAVQVSNSTVDRTVGVGAAPQRFYRIVQLAPASCLCADP